MDGPKRVPENWRSVLGYGIGSGHGCEGVSVLYILLILKIFCFFFFC